MQRNTKLGIGMMDTLPSVYAGFAVVKVTPIEAQPINSSANSGLFVPR